MAHQKPVQPSAEALKQGYEPEGVRLWTLAASFGILALVALIFMGVAAWLILGWTRHEREAEQIPSYVPAQVVNTDLPPLQPQPSHNRTAAQDYTAFNQHEDEVFDALGWKLQGPDNKPYVPNDIVTAVAAKHGGGH